MKKIQYSKILGLAWENVRFDIRTIEQLMGMFENGKIQGARCRRIYSEWRTRFDIDSARFAGLLKSANKACDDYFRGMSVQPISVADQKFMAFFGY